MQVELIDHFGGDDMAVNVARVSYAKKASEYTQEQNDKLIAYLVKHGHTSPFRHSQLQFRIKCPIYVERQLFKHQVGVSVNSISGRYVDFSDSYDMIKHGDWRAQSASSKQGSGDPLPLEIQTFAYEQQRLVVETAKKAYAELVKHGVSKEQARTILPLNLETEFIWTGSFLAFMHMCDLRLKSDTQRETYEVVARMLQEVKSLDNNPFEVSLKAFGHA